MRLPALSELNSQRELLTAFGGYNHNTKISEGEWYEQENMSVDNYPALCMRKERKTEDFFTTSGTESAGISGVFTFQHKITGMVYNNTWVVTTDETEENDDGEEVEVGRVYIKKNYYSRSTTDFAYGHTLDAELTPERIYYLSRQLNKIDDMVLAPGKKQLITYGAYVVIFPDKKYIKTIKSDDEEEYEYGDLEINKTITLANNNPLTFLPVNEELLEILMNDRANVEGGITFTYGNSTDDAENSAPANPTEGDYWISNNYPAPSVLNRCNAEGEWVSMTAQYLLLKCNGIGERLGQYQSVTISGVDDIVRIGIGNYINDINHIVYAVHHNEDTPANDFIALQTEAMDFGFQVTGDIHIARVVPDCDYVTVDENRLWGCRFGKNSEGQLLNQIFCSAQGDMFNWTNYGLGTSDCGFSTPVGSDGPFTGAITYNGCPMFFKRDCVYKVYGSVPTSFQVIYTELPGVSEGAGRSLVNIEEYLYYMSEQGVMRYDGTTATCISTAFGDKRYCRYMLPLGADISSFLAKKKAGTLRLDTDVDGACCGVWRNKLYVSCCDRNEWHLFSYDVHKAMWCREDCTRAAFFINDEDSLMFATDYYGTNNSNSYDHMTAIRSVERYKASTYYENTTKYASDWYCVSGAITAEGSGNKYVRAYTPAHKYVTRLTMRVSYPSYAWLKISIQYDGTGDFIQIGSVGDTTGNGSFNFNTDYTDTIKSVTIPMPIKRCDTYKIKLEGRGPVKVLSIAKDVESGSVL